MLQCIACSHSPHNVLHSPSSKAYYHQWWLFSRLQYMKMVHVHTYVDATPIHNSILVHKLKGSNCLTYNMNTLRKRPKRLPVASSLTWMNSESCRQLKPFSSQTVHATVIHNSILVHKLKGSNCLIYNMNTLRKRPQEIASGNILDEQWIMQATQTFQLTDCACSMKYNVR